MKYGNKVFVLGFFGFSTNQLDGQTVKTRNIYNLIKAREGSYGIDKVLFYDTQEFRYKRSSIFSLFKNLLLCDKLVLIPCINNLTYIFPVVYIISKFIRYDIIHVAIGGWQDIYFESHPFQSKMSKKIEILLLENSYVESQLQNKFGFQNVSIIPNFRIHNFTPVSSLNEGEFRIVFMSRINKKKGLDVIFEIANYISNRYSSGLITIDFYGSVLEEDRAYFYENLASHDFMSYHGVLQPTDIYETLTNYDLLILPTRYYTEGFPGAILDAYISGIPVLVSNWKHANEFVKDGVNGFVCDIEDVGEFCKVIDFLNNDRSALLKLKLAAWAKSKEYSEDKAWGIMKDYLC